MLSSMNEKNIRLAAWSLTSLVSILAIVAWGQLYDWQFDFSDVYQLFPLFGLLAFSIMWSHYVAAAMRIRTGLSKDTLKKYFDTTSLAVLAFILLHPGLFIWQLYRDGYGLPPNSYKAYVAEGMVVFILLGVISLWIFLAYELRHKFADRSWWKYVSYASDMAMLLIIIHSIQLGVHLRGGWYRWVWIFYSVSYVAVLFYLYNQKRIGRISSGTASQ